jgi:uncharacterized cupredoxin-like copper-binding protein
MKRPWYQVAASHVFVSFIAAFVLTTPALDPIAPAAGAVAGSCEAPALPPGTPTPRDEMAATAASDAGSVASVAAPTGRPADEATARRVIAGIENFVACRNAGDYAAYAALLTPNRMLAEAGTTNPHDVVADLQGFNLPITILSLGDVQSHADGRLSAEFVHLFGPHLYYRSRLYVVEEGGYVKFDEERFLPEEPPGAQSVVAVTMIDHAFALEPTTIPNAEFVVLRGRNDGAYQHEIIVAQLPAGATIEEVLSGNVPEDQVRFVGQTLVPPGQTDDLVLVDLESGDYWLVCLVAEPDGVPHAALGMVAQFTIEPTEGQ